jgi:hypothetical protein
MEEKVYTAEIIEETPFPGQEPIVVTESSAESGGTYNATTTNDKKPPVKRIAVELLSTALNTRSRKILQEFELEQSGGFKVGDYREGVTGDLRITPNGLTARDVAGITTFAIDGTTGDAIFKGVVQSGSLVSGTLFLGSEGGNVYIDGENQRIIINDGQTDRVLIGYGEGLF